MRRWSYLVAICALALFGFFLSPDAQAVPLAHPANCKLCVAIYSGGTIIWTCDNGFTEGAENCFIRPEGCYTTGTCTSP